MSWRTTLLPLSLLMLSLLLSACEETKQVPIDGGSDAIEVDGGLPDGPPPSDSPVADAPMPDVQPDASPDAALEWMSLWAASFGGAGEDRANAVAVDHAGNVFVAGNFEGTVSLGGNALVSKGGADIFVVKLDPGGSVLWAVSAGGTDDDLAKAIAVDSNGDCYVTGLFLGGAATFGATSLLGVLAEVFVAKLDADGGFVWAKAAGGNSTDIPEGIGASNDSLYVTGGFSYTANFGSEVLTSVGDAAGHSNLFVAKMDPATGAFSWVRQATGGADGSNSADGIAVDDAGDCYLTATYSGTCTFGASTLTSMVGSKDIVVAKLDKAGQFVWATSAGGLEPDYGRAIAVDAAGNTYITGLYNNDAVFGAIALKTSGTNDHGIYVAKLDPDGSFVWAKTAGGAGWGNYGRAIAADASGGIVVGGYFKSPGSFGAITLDDPHDVFVARLTADGVFDWALSGGGQTIDSVEAIAIDGAGTIYAAGFIAGPASFGSEALVASGMEDVLVWKIGLGEP